MISRLQYITQQMNENTHAQLAARACEGGIDWVQMRVKNASESVVLKVAYEVAEVCKYYGAKFIVNDYPEVAKKVKADGIHLGKEDMDPVDARSLLGNGFLIGGTANTWEDVQRLVKSGVDYIGIGPFRFTQTKEKLHPILGIEGYQEIIKQLKREVISLPLIAIGGIVLDDIPEILSAGMHGIAVAGAINHAIDPALEAGKFKAQIEKFVLQ